MADTFIDWESYRTRELEALTPLLNNLGFSLEEKQPHIGGERYLMQAITTTSGRKLILLGRRKKDNLRVIIKATGDEKGAKELQYERASRQMLHEINFAHGVFFSPEEILFTKQESFTISIQSFIDQARPFLERPLKEQFALVLKAFKAQEGAHATTYGHERLIGQTFEIWNAPQYLTAFKKFVTNIALARPHDAGKQETLSKAVAFIESHTETIEQYCGFLTHTDFVPHNFRIVDNTIYLLDHSSLRFGNKYEGWARLVNFMVLYNPELARAIVDYVRLNRTPEEFLALKILRVYRLGEIIWYYTNTLDKSSGNLHTLNTERTHLWHTVLISVLADKEVSPEYLEAYRMKREMLRSEDEKLRQKDLH